MKKILLNPFWALITLVLLLTTFLSQPVFLESVKLRYFDSMITSRSPTENNIYTVNIDEASLDKWGQWPFPRSVYAELIQDLYSRGAGLVIFNVMMPERDRFGGDQKLADVLAQFPVILPNSPSDRTKNEPKNPGAAIIGSEYMHLIPQYPGITANVPQVEQNAAGVGIVNTMPEVDGVTRRLPMVVAVNGVLYPSLALETLRLIAGDPNFQIRLNENGIERLRIPQFGPITTEPTGQVWIDWSQTSQRVSAVALPEDFNSAIVIVGVSAAGISNPVSTAVGSVFTQDIQAALLATMANNSSISRPDYMPEAETLFIAAVSILLILLSRWTFVGLGFALIMIVFPVAASQWAYIYHNMLIDATASTIILVLISLQVYGIKFVSEFLQKQAIKKQFAGYASPTVVKLLQEDPDLIKKGRKVPVSICFSDLRGFTPLGESFGKDVKGLTDVMNGYMDCISQPILDSNGMIIKYIGDATMHIHNAPIEDPNHPKTVVKVALEMVKAVKEYSKKLEDMGRPGVKMGAGINSGEGYVGEMGSKQRHSYDILGDDVSTCARIESKCKEYGCILLVGENTVNQCQNDFFFLKIDDLAVKGKTVGIRIYTVLDDVKPAYEHSRKRHDRMHEAYLKQDFQEAIRLCKQLKGHFDKKMDDYYDMWIERCEYMSTQTLPKDWNGVFIATTK